MLSLSEGGGNLSTAASKPDEFVSNKKEEKKLSTKAKVGIGAGILAFGGLVAAAVLSKGKTLGNVKLAEKITFKPAKTIEEARAFAKDKLGVQYIHEDNANLDMINTVNEWLHQEKLIHRNKIADYVCFKGGICSMKYLRVRYFANEWVNQKNVSVILAKSRKLQKIF